MSSYPPGVSGNEYEITGATYEAEESKECDNTDAVFVPAQMVYDGIASAVERLVAAGGDVGPSSGLSSSVALDKVAQDLRALVVGLQGSEAEYACDWSGDVDVAGHGSQKWWTCPRCGIEHTEEVDEGPDPDDQRDSAVDDEMDYREDHR